MRYFEIFQEDKTVPLPPDKPERDPKGEPQTAHQEPQSPPTEADLARQRTVMLGVIDRAAPLFKALAKK